MVEPAREHDGALSARLGTTEVHGLRGSGPPRLSIRQRPDHEGSCPRGTQAKKAHACTDCGPRRLEVLRSPSFISSWCGRCGRCRGWLFGRGLLLVPPASRALLAPGSFAGGVGHLFVGSGQLVTLPLFPASLRSLADQSVSKGVEGRGHLLPSAPGRYSPTDRNTFRPFLYESSRGGRYHATESGQGDPGYGTHGSRSGLHRPGTRGRTRCRRAG